MDKKFSYAAGVVVGEDLKKSGLLGILDMKDFCKGVRDCAAGKNTVDLQRGLSIVNSGISEVNSNLELERSKTNAEVLEAHSKIDGVVTTESGLQYRILKEGSGERPDDGSTVVCDYEGRLLDGTVFDSSVARGKPAEFMVGALIAGWREALKLMTVGSTYELWIPSDLGYGKTGVEGLIPGDSVLIFRVELIGIKK